MKETERQTEENELKISKKGKYMFEKERNKNLKY